MHAYPSDVKGSDKLSPSHEHSRHQSPNNIFIKQKSPLQQGRLRSESLLFELFQHSVDAKSQTSSLAWDFAVSLAGIELKRFTDRFVVASWLLSLQHDQFNTSVSSQA